MIIFILLVLNVVNIAMLSGDMFSTDLRPSVNYTFTVESVNSLGRSSSVNITATTPGTSISMIKLRTCKLMGTLHRLTASAVVMFTAAANKLWACSEKTRRITVSNCLFKAHTSCYIHPLKWWCPKMLPAQRFVIVLDQELISYHYLSCSCCASSSFWGAVFEH